MFRSDTKYGIIRLSDGKFFAYEDGYISFIDNIQHAMLTTDLVEVARALDLCEKELQSVIAVEVKFTISVVNENFGEILNNAIREQALRKLSPAERVALGLT